MSSCFRDSTTTIATPAIATPTIATPTMNLLLPAHISLV